MSQNTLEALFRRRALLQQQEAAAMGEPASAPQMGIQNPLMTQSQFANASGPRMTPQQQLQLQMLLRKQGMLP